MKTTVLPTMTIGNSRTRYVVSLSSEVRSLLDFAHLGIGDVLRDLEQRYEWSESAAEMVARRRAAAEKKPSYACLLSQWDFAANWAGYDAAIKSARIEQIVAVAA